MSTPGGGRTTTSLVGTVLDGRYRVGAMIARGGMSTVYRGSDLRLDRPVAIKVMSPSFAADPSFLTRFEREARAAAGLAHRGVVGVYDQGRDGTVVFLVMELVDGGTLRDLMRASGALSVSVTLSILEPLLAALGAAHAAGLVHRDVKPENVLISSKGEVKVADFGLVRAVTSQTMATGDVILGTVAYLSPEQVSTGAADQRSDVYAAGIVAYEMLTGHPPYQGDNPMSVAYQHVHSDVPPVTDRAPGVPMELDDLVLAATRRDPMARPRDAAAFLSALVSLRARLGLARVPVPVPRALPTSRRRPAAGGTAPTGTALTGTAAGGTALAGTARTGTARTGTARTGTAQTGTARTGTARTGTARTGAARTTAGMNGPSGTRVVPALTGAPTSATTAGPPHLPNAPLPSRSRLRRWLVVAIVVLLLGVAAAAGGWWLGSGRWAYTPGAVGIEQLSAENLVRQAGLVPQVSSLPSDTVPAGTVTDSNPLPGAKLLRGSEVDLVVSTGRPVVPVIAVGSAVPQARGLIEAAHLTPVENPDADRYDAAVAAGRVLGTDPAGNTSLPIAGVVTIIRSKGAVPQVVPSVAGKSLDDAGNKLLVTGLRLGRVEHRFSADEDAGTVLGTDPDEGQLVPGGSTVSIVVATSFTMPAVRGETSAAAVADLRLAGLTAVVGPAVFDPDVVGGCVAATDPQPGTRIDPAAPQVQIQLSDAVTVPDVTQGDVGDARDLLRNSGLLIDISAMFGSNGASVFDQQPSAGSRVPPGSTVRISAFP